MNQIIIFVILYFGLCEGIKKQDLYNFYNEAVDVLPRGNENFDFIKLATPVHFYSEVYDHIYINTNGILTFRSEFQNFLNIPFPLEYTSIAPFYSNVDTTLENDTAAITYFQSHDEDLLYNASDIVRASFSNAHYFQALSVFVATWENVGHYDMKNDILNTFQVAVICSADETYVQFLYPETGINWIQGDTGDSGLPDIRAQAGFVSEDGRFYTLKGSGTDNVRFLSSSSNIGEPGIWLYRIGPTDIDGNIEEPDVYNGNHESNTPRTCAAGGNFRCHPYAVCTDTPMGFCCSCKNGFYGNGQSCIKNDIPIRVSGSVVGTIGYDEIDAQLQSYVVMIDGRSYTAISNLNEFHGAQFQLLQILGGTIGWLFAKPSGNILNGYQITGGKFNYSSTIRFSTGEIFNIKQKYSGLNLWDQLSVDVEVSGDLPTIPSNDKLQMDDYTVRYTKQSDNEIHSTSEHRVFIPTEDRHISFNVYQQIMFERCNFVDQAQNNQFEGKLKATKINLGYEGRENATRMGMMSKVGESLSPCDDDSNNCGENTVCSATGDDTFVCNCKNGYTHDYSNDVVNCVDIDECSGEHICAEEADCYNEPGGYRCICNDGYEGNGYQCLLIDHEVQPEQHPYDEPTETDEHLQDHLSGSYDPYHNQHYDPAKHEDAQDSYEETSQTNHEEESRPIFQPHYPETNYYDNRHDNQSPEDSCQYCAENAECTQNTCQCRDGYHGDGLVCDSNCEADHTWNGDACIKIASHDEYEIDPFCNAIGCTCPAGYQIIEFAIGQTCRLIDTESSPDYGFDEESCDVIQNCHQHANCEYNDVINRYECVCIPGFDGNGYDCIEKDVSCLDEEDICDTHASCNYIHSLKKSVCVCDKGYEGDGRYCKLAPECYTDDDCGINSVCQQGICICASGYERDVSDFCVLAGSCGGTYCVENAICNWDNRKKASYCHCPDGFIGDGIKVCKSIPPACNIRNNCGLYASCAPNYREPSKYECSCDPGYFGDGFVCTPERNCKNIPELCDSNANCASTTSGFQCICNTGFIGNGSVCNTAPRLDSGFLLISQGVAAVRIPFTGARGYPVAMAQMAIGLDKDCAEGRIYWSDISAKQIMSCKYDGTDRKPFITEDILSPEGVAVDWISRRLYWTDSAKDTIEVASLDNPALRTVLIQKYLVNPRGIAIDPHQNKLYWSDWNRESPKIEWANLDGTERQVLLAEPAVQLPNSLAIASNTGELCYADAGTFKVECIDTYSRAVRVVAGNLSYPFGLAITDDHFYWTDWTTKKIESIDLYGTRKPGIPTPLFGSHKMYGMAAITEKCPLFFSPCVINNGGCPENRICLTNPQAPSGRSCKCTDIKNCNDVLQLED